MSKRYEVVGTSRIMVNGVEHQPGDVFDADISESQEAYFLEIGAVVPLDPTIITPSPSAPAGEESEDQ